MTLPLATNLEADPPAILLGVAELPQRGLWLVLEPDVGTPRRVRLELEHCTIEGSRPSMSR